MYFYLVRYTFSNTEKLKSKKHIEALFTEGETCSKYPLKMVYKNISFSDDVPVKAGVSVSKRNFKKAVDRNRIKRLLRECYRLNKHLVYHELNQKYVIMFLYLGKEMPNFHDLNKKMERLLIAFKSNIEPNISKE